MSVQQVRSRFEIEYGSSIEDFPESVYMAGIELSDRSTLHHAKCIERSHRSSILWGYTSKDSIDILEKFFPDDKDAGEQK